MARRSFIIPIVSAVTTIQPLPYSPVPPFPGLFPPAGTSSLGFPSPFEPYSPFGLPPLPGFLGGVGGGPFGNINPLGNVNVGGGAAQNIAGGLLGGINQDQTTGGVIASMGGGAMGIAKINNVVVPPTTAVGVPFTLQIFFTNNSSMPMQFAAVLNVQGLGVDMVQTPNIAVQPGQAGTIAQNMQIPAQTAGNASSYPGSVQIVHHDVNGMQILDDQTTFTIPAPMAVATTMVDATGAVVDTTKMPTNTMSMASMPMMAMTGPPSTVTPDTMMAAITGATPTLPSTPGVGIVPMNSMTAMHADWNPNDPMHMRWDRGRHLGQIKHLQARIMALQAQLKTAPMAQQMQIQMTLTNLQDRLNKLQMLSMMKPVTTTTMQTDELGQTTTTTTTTSKNPPNMMNPLQNNDMDFGFRDQWGQLNRMGQLPINSAMNQVPGTTTPPMMPVIPMGPATPPFGFQNLPGGFQGAPIQQQIQQALMNIPNIQQGAPGGVGMPGAAGGVGGPGGFQMNTNWTPYNHQSFWQMPMQMQRTASFQFQPWMSPNTGQPGMLAVPMMQWGPQGFMVPGAMLATDLDNTPSYMDGEGSTPFNDELDIMLLGRNRDREQMYDVPMPRLVNENECILCGDNNDWAVIIAENDGGSGLDIPTDIMGYNFCPGEAVRVTWHVVLYGNYGVEGQIFRGHDTAHADHSGRFLYHLRLPDIPDAISGDGIVSAHGTTSKKHANTTLSAT